MHRPIMVDRGSNLINRITEMRTRIHLVDILASQVRSLAVRRVIVGTVPKNAPRGIPRVRCFGRTDQISNSCKSLIRHGRDEDILSMISASP